VKAALIALEPDLPIGFVIDDIVEGVADRIYWAWWEYRMTVACKAGPSQELRNLGKALSEWLDKHPDREGYHLHQCDEEKKNALLNLNHDVNLLIVAMESDKPKLKKRQEQPETTFFRSLYKLYRDMRDAPTLSNDGYGSGVRFITECAALVGIATPRGLRQLISSSMSRDERAKMGSE
jgi:hypothetical protein